MSFSIPAITSVEVTAAVPKFAWKTYYELQVNDPPVKDTKYTLIEEEDGVELLWVGVRQTNTETDPKAVDIEIKVDGVTRIYDSSDAGRLDHNDDYWAMLYSRLNATEADMIVAWLTNTRPYPFNFNMDTGAIDNVTLWGPLKGHDISVKYTLTDTAGTAQKLLVFAAYRKLEAV